MLVKARNTDYLISPDSVEQIPSVSLIDIRSQEQFIIRHLENAINVPLPDILSDTHQDLFQQDITKVIVSDDLTKAHEAWMLLTQLGYEKVFVLSTSPDSGISSGF